MERPIHLRKHVKRFETWIGIKAGKIILPEYSDEVLELAAKTSDNFYSDRIRSFERSAAKHKAKSSTDSQ